MQKHTIRDGLRFGLTPARLRVPVFRLITAVQTERPEVQIGALLLAADLWCRMIGADTHEELARVRRMLADAERNTEHVRAITDYFREEWKLA